MYGCDGEKYSKVDLPSIPSSSSHSFSLPLEEHTETSRAVAVVKVFVHFQNFHSTSQARDLIFL